MAGFSEKEAIEKLKDKGQAPNPGGLTDDELARWNWFKNMFKDMSKPS